MLCAANQVGKMLGGNWVLEDVRFQIGPGERVGLVGPNGCGKTTLLRLLAGMETPDRGDIFIGKEARTGYLEQVPGTDPAATVWDALRAPFEGVLRLEKRMERLAAEMADPGLAPAELDRVMKRYESCQEDFEKRGGYETEARIRRVAHGLNLSEGMLARPFGSLSGGEKTKIGLAQILLSEADLLLLDEPTNHLDLMAIEWLEEYLSQYRGAVLVVSHDRCFLDRVVNRVIDLEGGESQVYPGNYSAFIREKEERLLAEFQAYQEQQKKIKKMKETIKRLREWANRANPPNAGLHRRAASMEKALERMERLDRPVLERKKIDLTFQLDQRSGQDVFRCEEVYKEYGEDLILDGVNLLVRSGERVAIVGENGSGKSTLLRILLGMETADLGKVAVGPSVKVGCLSQQGWEGDPGQSVLDAFREEVPVEEGEARHRLARFLFCGYDVYRRVGDLSGGERIRLRLAQLMHRDLNALILDEPTNHLDIDSREVLEDALERFQGTVLAVSHDRYFLNKLFAPVCWLEKGKLTRYEGNYDEARRKRAVLQEWNR
ncbi:ATPase subunit of ABC transporter with duplicated ATPase domains [Melghirimyces profundicolus]|uniref:ATPase subunit of ABC transporter with duplicated ATPase domains n=1 Tax=Melghirimyces profundicolus TaxID=1242148 RepID=A0A2T6BSP0_9BACL|nr:ABC-F family ATP-binding cassette domain-containing protein [Melghirimyces profundicolus]PTX59111.1 ATPase subunit of ABC transporter with duplicated ATPase domains [Melghirimyces profundicolus]